MNKFETQDNSKNTLRTKNRVASKDTNSYSIKPLHGGVFLMKQKINHRFSRWFFMCILPVLHTRQNAYVM